MKFQRLIKAGIIATALYFNIGCNNPNESQTKQDTIENAVYTDIHKLARHSDKNIDHIADSYVAFWDIESYNYKYTRGNVKTSRLNDGTVKTTSIDTIHAQARGKSRNKEDIEWQIEMIDEAVGMHGGPDREASLEGALFKDIHGNSYEGTATPKIDSIGTIAKPDSIIYRRQKTSKDTVTVRNSYYKGNPFKAKLILNNKDTLNLSSRPSFGLSRKISVNYANQVQRSESILDTFIRSNKKPVMVPDMWGGGKREYLNPFQGAINRIPVKYHKASALFEAAQEQLQHIIKKHNETTNNSAPEKENSLPSNILPKNTPPKPSPSDLPPKKVPRDTITIMDHPNTETVKNNEPSNQEPYSLNGISPKTILEDTRKRLKESRKNRRNYQIPPPPKYSSPQQRDISFTKRLTPPKSEHPKRIKANVFLENLRKSQIQRSKIQETKIPLPNK